MRQKLKVLWIYDRWIIISTLFLLALGLLMVASASMVISDWRFSHPFHYFIHQLTYLIIGLLIIIIVSYVPIKVLQKYSSNLLLLSFLLLIMVLFPRIGRTVNGSRRWIQLGFFSLQVSEVVKLAAILYLANYLNRYQNIVCSQELKGFLKPIILLTFLTILLLLEPDFGSVVVITMIYMALLFLSGMRLWPFFILLFLVIISLIALVVLSHYRLRRLTAFLHPWNNAFGSGYQLTQSLIAFGRGGLFGVGLGNGIQKLFYLPEAYTDFLFAVLAEELGLIGELLLFILFIILIVRIFIIGRLSEINNQLFSAYVSYGFALWFWLQILINIGVNVGVLPIKGLTLPLISYGGSSMLISCLVVGILLRISRETQQEHNEKKKRFRLTNY
ncbi:putative lipid II flippase FtsW [Coxiella endosymbiont of Amblyomma americanum]|uniref:putative lipid II flippase FtsW n=1 Tax=Coxiella endosymbiont of Amblyomma americanum TaxID=325775 RepID=UPI0005822B49|nr:putative lipid II flippase FtsW [Coxiella endosymbiont of Amblyomma americanum]AJC50393.1 cell division protein FtsW [Coxiella endosymbiont of Amblyomma americanum]AUJ58734.1 cell division protein FtsW [Coxiella-like endosymbiont of Amblyomma americanum]